MGFLPVRRRCKQKSRRMTKVTRPKTPPTVPPAIAPTFIFDLVFWTGTPVDVLLPVDAVDLSGMIRNKLR
jgi:hypothetical protein